MPKRMAGAGILLSSMLSACADATWRLQAGEEEGESTGSYGYYYSSGVEAFFEKGSSLPVSNHTEFLSSGSVWEDEEFSEKSKNREFRAEMGPSFSFSEWKVDVRSGIVRADELEEGQTWLGMGPRVQTTYSGVDDLEVSGSIEYLNGLNTYSRVSSSFHVNYAWSDVLSLSLSGEYRNYTYLDYGDLIQETTYSAAAAVEYAWGAGSTVRPVVEIGTIDWSYGETKHYYRFGLGMHYELLYGASLYAEPGISIYEQDYEYEPRRRGIVKSLAISLLTPPWPDFDLRAMVTYYAQKDQSTTDSFTEFEQMLRFGFEREF